MNSINYGVKYRETISNTWLLCPLYRHQELNAFTIEMPYGNIRPRCAALVDESGLLSGTYRLEVSKDRVTEVDEFGQSIWHIEYKPEEEQSKLKMDTQKVNQLSLDIGMDMSKMMAPTCSIF